MGIINSFPNRLPAPFPLEGSLIALLDECPWTVDFLLRLTVAPWDTATDHPALIPAAVRKEAQDPNTVAFAPHVRVKVTPGGELVEVLDQLQVGFECIIIFPLQRLTSITQLINPKSSHKVLPIRQRLSELHDSVTDVTELYLGATLRKPTEKLQEDTASATRALTAFQHRFAETTPEDTFESFVLHELVQADIPTRIPALSDNELTRNQLWRLHAELWPVEQLTIAAGGAWWYVDPFSLCCHEINSVVHS